MSVYIPAEDSYLMSRILKEQLPSLLKKNPNLKFLEIGAGSGIHLQTASSLGIKNENIFSSDIDKRAVSHCNLLGFNCIHSDLFEQIKGKYDILVFNPPYLPEDAREPKSSKTATTGGKKGNEIIIKFLEQAKFHLNKNGKIFLITSSLSEDVDFKHLGYDTKEIGCEKLFFERLCIWELTIY
jgi:release factor glutamine methyltransferase